MQHEPNHYENSPYAEDTDIAAANRVLMLMRDALDHEAVCTMASNRITLLSHQLAALKTVTTHRLFQARVAPWMRECFGDKISMNKVERADRFGEEALEAIQQVYHGTVGNEEGRRRAHTLVDYVFSRPVGELRQEVGGVMVTLAALCLATDLDMHKCGDDELERVWTKIDKIRAKQAGKRNIHSPLPVDVSPNCSDENDILLPAIEPTFDWQGAGFEAGTWRARAEKAEARLEKIRVNIEQKARWFEKDGAPFFDVDTTGDDLGLIFTPPQPLRVAWKDGE
jgi:hypothetical protein